MRAAKPESFHLQVRHYGNGRIGKPEKSAFGRIDFASHVVAAIRADDMGRNHFTAFGTTGHRGRLFAVMCTTGTGSRVTVLSFRNCHFSALFNEISSNFYCFGRIKTAIPPFLRPSFLPSDSRPSFLFPCLLGKERNAPYKGKNRPDYYDRLKRNVNRGERRIDFDIL